MTTKVCSIGTLTLLLDTLCPICNYRTESQVCILLPRLLAEEAGLPLPVWLKKQCLLLECFPAQCYPFTFQTRTSASPCFNFCLYTSQTIAPNKHFTLTYMKYPLQPNLLAIFDNGHKKNPWFCFLSWASCANPEHFLGLGEYRFYPWSDLLLL